MAGGIDISQGAAETLAEGSALAIVSVSTGANSPGSVLNSIGITVPTLGPYRDKQQNKAAVYALTVPASGTATGNTYQVAQQAPDGTFTIPAASVTASTMYVFDAVLVANHSKRWTPTKKPLQSGYNFSDHIIKDQPVVTLEIGMSDAMAAYAPGMWVGNPSKSISAWQKLNKLADQRILFTLSTRQETYTNMAIVGIESPETNKTVKSMRARITFEQQLIVDVTSETISARPNATDSTQQATLQGTAPDASTLQQNEVTPSALPAQNSNSVLGPQGVPVGGQFDSNNITTSGTGF
jgi:hypothetical protein